ncbi:type I glyceraldehyde-3-phosphate dehydrogenase [Psychroflexus sp. MES1-P1E]|uniref:type I glyceraldehyde-3-phosphate dehydrogenase n=1 Tax=Psychroflexus sp. MES1-P1E TaxID=2058320 RepID=UPI000C7A3549|nr:type I glyceraldehyde-3-phosphate dehydrogenase [Psychroflexus sp. MES1-P1E]PKG43820.1 type I glyceraldehyde-3-phosphate dehydrogenase [Psychroflexus sp. MES1-P1E]
MQNHIRVGINGFGRIGRSLFRLLYQHPNIEVTAINDLSDARTLSHLLKYDSVHGQFPFEVSYNKEGILIQGELFPLTSSSKLEDLKWSDFGVDTLVECTGQFKTEEKLKYHLYAGAKKVILSVPPSDDSVKMIVLGVNDNVLEEDDIMISNASCTTNNAAPMLKVIHDAFQVEQAYITTVHSYTSDQSLQDKPHRDLRRARAATQSIIPTTTGAAKALTKIFPDLNNVIGGCGIRVPVPNGSLTDMTLNVKTSTSIKEVNELFKKASENELKGILQYTEVPLVSIDIVGNSYSCVFDAEMTSVIGGNLIKLIGWYDNEQGYSSRLVDLILKMG